ncbi:hypothetical protein [Streptomyces sp. NPDC001135]
MPVALPAWDYATDVTVTRLIRVNQTGAREDCGFPADAPLRLCVRYWPSTSQIRVSVVQEVLPIGEDAVTSELHFTATGTDLGGMLTVETTLELASDLPYSDPFVATRLGSILWSDRTTVHLEGASGLLPVAPVSFREAGLPECAAWYVSMDSGDWQQAAMGSLLVLLNEDNLTVKRAMNAEGDETSAVLWGILEADIVSDLVGRALDDEAFTDEESAGDSDDEVTMAGLVRALIRTYLARPGETTEQSVKRLRDERRRDPSRFRANVQAGVRFPREHA